MNDNFSIVMFIISILTTGLTAGIAVGVFRAKLAHVEKGVNQVEKDVNQIGKRVDDDLENIKSDFIKPLSDRLTESEADRRNLAMIMSRMEEALKLLGQTIEKRLDKLEKKLEEFS